MASAGFTITSTEPNPTGGVRAFYRIGLGPIQSLVVPRRDSTVNGIRQAVQAAVDAARRGHHGL